MIDSQVVGLDEEIRRILSAKFFSRMGFSDLHDDNIILIKNVRNVFVEPSDIEFKGLYRKTEWLPTSPTQDDPFYKKQKNPKDIVEVRKEISKHLMNATKGVDKSAFISSPHDFSIAARNAICFAFRQLITERYFSLGDKWEGIVEIYYSGHWPVGYAKDKLIVI